VAEFPWVFDYSDDPVVGTESRWGHAVFRPLVEIRVIGPEGVSDKVYALIDSGTEYTLMMRWVAQSIGARIEDGSAIPLGTEPVKDFETTTYDFFCTSVSIVGLLIHAAVGSLGGLGRRLPNRHGLAA
jgi:hypothetical protein